MATENSRDYILQPQHFLHPLEPEAWRSDYIVPDAAQEEFIEMRCVLQNHLAFIDIEITRAQSLSNDVMTQRNKCVLRIQEIDHAIAPHKRLPAEILVTIFSHCISGVRLPRSTKGGDPWHIGSVYSRWRHIAFNTKSLWNSLAIHEPSSDGDLDTLGQTLSVLRILEFAKQILPLGTRNLEILITQQIENPVGVDFLGNILLPYVTQFERLLLTCCPTLLIPFISSPPPLFLALEELFIQSFGAKDRYIEPYNRSDAIFHVFSNAPHLRKCTHHFMDQKIRLHKFYIPWGQLTQLAITLNIKITDISLFLSQCTSLEKCRLRLESALTGRPVTMSRNVLIMPHLRSLHIGMHPIYPLSGVINMLVLPSLVTLSLGGRIVFDDLARLVVRSKCNLKAFTTLTPSVFSAPEVFLQAVSPTLKSLSAGFQMDVQLSTAFATAPYFLIWNGFPTRCLVLTRCKNLRGW